MKRIVVVPDIQFPLENRRAVKAVLRFLGEYHPDEVVQIGDLTNQDTAGRWSKAKAAEFQGSLKGEVEHTKRYFFEPLREVYQGPLGIIEGNHDARARQYLYDYAPALAESKAFHMDNLLDFKRYEAVWLPDFYEFAPGWIMTHGHLGGIRLKQQPGQTALGAATERFLKNVIMGHTHRLGAMTRSYGYDQKVTRMLTGVEVGHLMDMRRANYLKGGAANWQSGFAIVYVDGSYVRPELIPILNGKFTVEGETFAL